MVFSVSTFEKKGLIFLYIFFFFIVIAKLPLSWIKPAMRPLEFMGRICYSFYLMHVLAIWIAPKALQAVYTPPPDYSSLLIFSMAAFLAFVFGVALYRFVERPMIDFGKRI